MKNYRDLQTCLDQTMGEVGVERRRAEAIFNDLARLLINQAGVPKQCLVFAILNDGAPPLVSPGAKDFVLLDDDRKWFAQIVLRIFKTGPRAEYVHILLKPTLLFRDEAVVIEIEELRGSRPEVPLEEGGGHGNVVHELASLVTEAAAQRIEKIAGGDDRVIGFDAD